MNADEHQRQLEEEQMSTDPFLNRAARAADRELRERVERLTEQLAEPFPVNQVSWRIGSTNARSNGGNPTQGKPLAYLNARDVMSRLDSVVGIDNWQDSYQDTGSRLLCTLGIKVNGEWVYKTDGAGDTNMEGEKGGISDAFKRAAVKWGIGRYLYGCNAPWIDLEKGRLPKSFDGSKYLPGFASAIARTKVWNLLRDAAAENDAGKAVENWRPLTSEQQHEIWSMFSSGQRSTIKELLASVPAEDEEAA